MTCYSWLIQIFWSNQQWAPSGWITTCQAHHQKEKGERAPHPNPFPDSVQRLPEFPACSEPKWITVNERQQLLNHENPLFHMGFFLLSSEVNTIACFWLSIKNNGPFWDRLPASTHPHGLLGLQVTVDSPCKVFLGFYALILYCFVFLLK